MAGMTDIPMVMVIFEKNHIQLIIQAEKLKRFVIFLDDLWFTVESCNSRK